MCLHGKASLSLLDTITVHYVHVRNTKVGGGSQHLNLLNISQRSGHRTIGKIK